MSTDFTITPENTNNTQSNLSITTNSNLTPQPFIYNTESLSVLSETVIIPNEIYRITDTNSIFVSGYLQDNTFTGIENAVITLSGLESNVSANTNVEGYFNKTVDSLISGTIYTVVASTETTDTYNGTSITFGNIAITEKVYITPISTSQLDGTFNINVTGNVNNINNVGVPLLNINITGLGNTEITQTDTFGNFNFVSSNLTPNTNYTIYGNVNSQVYSSNITVLGNITLQKVLTTITPVSLYQISGSSNIYVSGLVQNYTSNANVSNVLVTILGLDTTANIITNNSGLFSYTTSELLINSNYYPNAIVSSNLYTSVETSLGNIFIEKISANIIPNSLEQLLGTSKILISGQVKNLTTDNLIGNTTVNIYGLPYSTNVNTDALGVFSYTSQNLLVSNDYTITANILSNTYTSNLINFGNITINKINTLIIPNTLQQISGTSNIALTGTLINATSNAIISNEIIHITGVDTPANVITDNSGNFYFESTPLLVGKNYIPNVSVLSDTYYSNTTSFSNITLEKIPSIITQNSGLQIIGTSNVIITGSLINSITNANISNEIIRITGLDTPANVVTDLSGIFSYTSEELIVGFIYTPNVELLSDTYTSNSSDFTSIEIQPVGANIIENSITQVSGSSQVLLDGTVINGVTLDAISNVQVNITGLGPSSNVFTDTSGNFSLTSVPLMVGSTYTPQGNIISNNYFSELTNFSNITISKINATLNLIELIQINGSSNVSLTGNLINSTTKMSIPNEIVSISGFNNTANVITDQFGVFNYLESFLTIGNSYYANAIVVSNVFTTNLTSLGNITINKINSTLNLTDFSQVIGTSNLSITGTLTNTTTGALISNELISITGLDTIANVYTNSSGSFNYVTSPFVVGTTHWANGIVVSNTYISTLTSFGNVTISNLNSQLIFNNIYQIFGTKQFELYASLYNPGIQQNISNVIVNLYGLDTTYNLTTDTNGNINILTGNLTANSYILTANLTSNDYTVSGLYRRTQTTSNGNTYVYTTSSFNGNITVLPNTRNQVYSLSGNSMMSTNQVKYGYASLANAVTITSIGTSTFLTDWTIEFWFYSTTNNFVLKSLVNSNLFNITFNNTVVSVTIGFTTSTYNLTLTTSSWYHCAIVFSVNQLAVFINGDRICLVSNVVYAVELDQLFIQSGYIDELRIVRDSTIYDTSVSSIIVPTGVFTLNNKTLLLNHFNGANTSTDVTYFDDSIGIASYNFATFNYFYSVKDAYLSNNYSLNTYSTSLALNSSESKVYLRNLIPFWNGLWTIQFWIYVPTLTNSTIIASSTNYAFELNITSSGYLLPKLGRGSAWIINSNTETTTNISTNTWTHVAIVYNNGRYTLYIAGNSVLNISSTFIVPSTTINNMYINYFGGYISNLQIDRTARYTSSFTPSINNITRDYYTLLQNSFNGTTDSIDLITTEDTNLITSIPSLNQNQIYTQSTTSLVVSNTFAQFGNSSLYIPSGGVLTINQLGSNTLTTEWTIEFFLRNIVQTLVLSDTNSIFNFSINSTNLSVTINSITSSVSNTLTTGWFYIAFVYNQGSFVLYVNSVSKITGTGLIPSFTLNTLNITSLNGGCYLDELRISRVARNISTPSAIYSVDSDTVLLNHFENYSAPNIIDASDEILNKYTVNSSNVFPHTYVSYNNASLNTTTKKFGTASIYFDGSSGLIIDNIPVNLTNYWTLEFWVYIVSGSSTGIIASTNGNYGLQLLYNSSTSKLELSLSTNGTSWNFATNVATSSTITSGTWNFIVISSDTTYKLFLNGNQEISVGGELTTNIVDIGFTYNTIGNASFSKTVFFQDNGSLDLSDTSTGGSRGIVINGPIINTSNAWTIECYIRISSFSADSGILLNGQAVNSSSYPGNTAGFSITVTSSGQISWTLGNGSTTFLSNTSSGTAPIQLNTWHHIAVSFDGTTHSLFVDGTQIFTTSTSSRISTDAFRYLAIGRYSIPLMRGFISHIRLSTIARYTSNFTRPTRIDNDSDTILLAPLTTDTTLTHVNQYIYTNNSLSYKFLNAGYYFSTSTFKADNGSLNLGSNGTLQIINNNTNNIDVANPWTVEMFFNITQWQELTLIASDTPNRYFRLMLINNGPVQLVLGDGTSWLLTRGHSSEVINLNTWYHIALVFTGTFYAVYVNGTEFTSTRITSTMTLGTGSTAFNIISLQGTNRFVSHLRISNTALYTNNFTSPNTLVPTSSTVLFSQLTTLNTVNVQVPKLPVASMTPLSFGNLQQNLYTNLFGANVYIDEINFLNLQKYYSNSFVTPGLPLNYRTSGTLLLNHFNGNANVKTYFDSEETNYINSYPIYTLINGNISTSTKYFGTASVYLTSTSYLYLNNLNLTTTYTIEFFYKFNSQVSGSTRYIMALSTGETLYHSGTAWTHSSPNLTSTSSFDTSNWYYICYTRSGTTLTIKIINTSTNAIVTLTGTNNNSAPSYIYFYTNATTTMYVDNLRISNTASIITTVPTNAYTTLDSSVVLINNFNGTNNSTDITSTDQLYSSVLTTSSSNSFTTSYQLYNCNISNTNYKFGSSSLLIDGNNLFSFLTINLGQRYIRGNFTIEFWFYPITWGEGQTNGACLMSFSYTEVNNLSNRPNTFVYIDNSTGKLNCTMVSTNRTGNTVVTKNTWHHFALVHNGNGYFSVYLDGNREMYYNTDLFYENNFLNPIIIGRQFVYNTTQASFQYINTNLVSKNNFTGYIDELMISRESKYSGSTVTSYTSQQTQTYYTVLFNHFENADIIQSEDTSYVTSYTTPTPYLTSYNAFQGYLCVLSKEYTKFSPSSLYMHPNYQQNSFFYINLGLNVILSSWTFEIWVYGTFISNNFVCASNVSNPIITINSSIPSNLQPINGLSDWTYFAESYDASTGTRYTYVNGTLYITTTNASIIYASYFDQLMISTGGGYIDSFKLSDIARYTSSTITNYNTAFVSDSNTFVIKSFLGPHGLNVSRKDDSILYTFTDNSPGISTDGQIYEISPYRQYNESSKVLYYTYGNVNIDTSVYTTNSTGSCLIDNRTTNSIFIVGMLENYIKGDFTLEFWFKPLVTNGILLGGFGTRSRINSKRDYVYVSSGKLNWRSATISSIVTGTTTMNTSTWYHIAVVYTNATLKIYVNGTLDITVSNIYYSGSETTRFVICTPYYDASTVSGMSGYIDLLRISNNARYSNTFTPNTTFTKDNNTICLNTFDGTNGSTDIIGTEDLTSITLTYGTKSTNYTYSVSNAVISTLQGVFNSSSLYIPANANVQITGYNSNYLVDSWTIEYFTYSNTPIYINVPSGNTPIGNDKFQLNYQVSEDYSGASNYNYFYDNYYFQEQVVTGLSANIWNHVAIVYNNYQVKYFINGTKSTLYAVNTRVGVDYVTRPSASIITNLTFSSNGGYIDCLRISDTARYSGNSYIVPTNEFSLDANTVVLNNFNTSAATKLLYLTDPIINSNYNISIDTTLFNIFYVIYGSAVLSTEQYKFGTKSLKIVNNSYVVVSGINITSTWSIDCWFYLTSTTTQTLISSYDNIFSLSITYSASKIIAYLGNGSSWSINSTAGTTTINANNWYHLSLVYTGSAYVLYINGSVDISVTSTTVVSFSNLFIGVQDSSYTNNTIGYIDELLITNSILRTGTFTAPTSAYTLRYTAVQVLNHFDNTTLIDSEDTNFLLQTLYIPSDPVLFYIQGYHTNGATDLATSTGLYMPTLYPIHSTSNYSFSNTYSKFGSTSLYIASGNFLTFAVPNLVLTQFTLDFWYNRLSGYTTGNIVDIGYPLQFAWNINRIVTNYGISNATTNTINTGTWYFLQFIFTQTSITAYINGTNVYTFINSGNYNSFTIAYLKFSSGYYNNIRFTNNTSILVSVPTLDYSYDKPQLSTSNYKFGTSSLKLSTFGSMSLNYLTLSGNWTIEFWFYSDNMNSAIVINSSLLQVVLNNTSVVLIVNSVSTTSNSFSSIASSWNHISIVSSYGAIVLYLNGSSLCSYSYNLSLSSLTLGNTFNGFIDELRVSKYAVYTSSFTPPTSSFTFTSTCLVLNHFEGTNGSTVFNYSDDALIDFYGLTYETTSTGVIYQNYNVTLSTTASRWGSQSAYFDGLMSYFTAVVPFTSGNYTIQGWVYVTNLATDMGIFGFASPYNLFLVLQASTQKLKLYIGTNGTSWNLNSTNSGTTTINTNTWYWISVSYNGRTWNVYVNSTLDYSFDYFNYTNIFNTNIVVGKMIDNQGNYNQFNFNGYIDDFSVMSIAFTTLPTAVLVPYTYTLLLNHFESSSLSTSEDTTTQTSYTNPNATSHTYSIQAPIYYSPYALFNCNRVIATNYNSGNDTLNISNINSNLFNTPWTLETWALWPSAGAGGTGLQGCNLYLGPVTLLASTYYNSVSAAQTGGIQSIGILNYSITVNIAPISFNTWYHFAITYDGASILKIYINGTLYNSVPITVYANYFYYVGVNCTGGSYYSSVFINGFRASNTVRYTSNFTVPTGFFSYDSNTLMLFNLPNNAPKWGVSPNVFDLVKYPVSITYTSNTVTYYWVNNGATIATLPSNIFGNSTALFCQNSTNFTGIGNSRSTIVFSDYVMPGDFTVEMWIYIPTTVRTNQTLFSFPFMGIFDQVLVDFANVAFNCTIANFGTPSVNTWHHIAVCFNSIDFTFSYFINGTLLSTSPRYTWRRGNFFEVHPTPYYLNLGCNMDNSQNLNGYISNFRLSNCRRYIGNYNVPTSSFTRDMYTVSLNLFNGTNGTVNLMNTENVSLVSYVNTTYDIFYSFYTANSAYTHTMSPMAYTTSIRPFTAAGGSLGIGNNLIKINGLSNNTCQDSWTYELWFMLTTPINTLYLLNYSSQLLQFYVQYVNPTTISVAFFSQRYYNADGNNPLYKNPLSYIQNYSLSLNTWCHAAISFDGDTYRLFMNGTLLYSNIYYNKHSRNVWANLSLGGSQYSSTFGGYITGLRLSNNCRYTSSFTPSTSVYTYDSNTIIANYFGSNLNKFEFYDIANQIMTTSYDSNDTWYLSNNATLSTSQYKFGTKSLYLSGDNSFVKIYPSLQWYGSFTIQFWFYLNSYVGNENPYLFTSAHGQLNAFALYIEKSTGLLILPMIGVYPPGTTTSWWKSTTTISTGTWYHFALCYDPVITGNAYAYLNGTLEGKFFRNGSGFNSSTGISYPIFAQSNVTWMLKGLVLGRQYIASSQTNISANSFNGYIDEFIYSNYPKYNDTTAPSTTQKTRDKYDLVFNTFEGTTLIGGESTPVTYTYTPNYNYSYFDPHRSITYETTLTKTNTLFNMNTSLSFLNDQKRCVTISNLVELGGSWTNEFWCYIPTITGTGASLYTFYNAGDPANNPGYVYIDTNYRIGWTPGTSTTTVIPNSWNHIAIQFDLVQASLQLFVNGKCAMISSINTITSGPGYLITAYKVVFKNYQLNLTGAYYISELRISNILRYTTPTYTVPTSIFTVDSNTLLLNHFNGIDKANNLTWYNDPVLLGNINLSFVTNPSGISYINFGTQLSNTRVKYGSCSLSVSNAYLVMQNLSFTTTEWSIEMWYYPLQSSGTIICDYRADYKIAVIHNTSLFLYVGDDTSWSIVNGLTSGTNISTNTWHHVAIVFSGLMYYLYLDGNLELSVASTTNIQSA